jgi:hypothetical protein
MRKRDCKKTFVVGADSLTLLKLNCLETSANVMQWPENGPKRQGRRRIRRRRGNILCIYYSFFFGYESADVTGDVCFTTDLC